MPARLVEHLQRLRGRRRAGNPERLREEIAGHLGKICAILRRETGHDFRRYKQSTLVRRVRRRMSEIARPLRYMLTSSRLSSDAKEVEQLFRDLLISVTHFFRDPEAFDAPGRARSFPGSSRGRTRTASCGSGCPGCATGEEAYSLAILLREHMAERSTRRRRCRSSPPTSTTRRWRSRAQALYPEAIAGQISPERLERFFVSTATCTRWRARSGRCACSRCTT